nr:MAG TPA: hypothetical protein [Caudoviricetes sp.]
MGLLFFFIHMDNRPYIKIFILGNPSSVREKFIHAPRERYTEKFFVEKGIAI